MREVAQRNLRQLEGPLKNQFSSRLKPKIWRRLMRKAQASRCLTWKTLSRSLELRRDFGLAASERVRKIERIRLAHRRPLAYVISYLPSRIAAQVRIKGMKTIPLSTVIESSLRIKISDVKHIVEAKLSDDAVSSHLDIPQGSPVLYVERDHFYKKRLIMRTARLLPKRPVSLRAEVETKEDRRRRRRVALSPAR